MKIIAEAMQLFIICVRRRERQFKVENSVLNLFKVRSIAGVIKENNPHSSVIVYLKVHAVLTATPQCACLLQLIETEIKLE